MSSRIVQDRLPEAREPTRLSTTVFAVKVKLLQLRRGVQDRRDGMTRHAPTASDTGEFPHIVAEVRSRLWSDETAAERRLQFGKVQNLRMAARHLNGVTVPANTVLSFWKQIGRATGRRGFAYGRELREGCIIPALGGGLCQLSNALYEAALRAGLEVVERHPHTRRVPGSAAEVGRDATVFWNYLDLRLRSPHSWRLEVTLTETELIVRFRSATPAPKPVPAPRPKIFVPLLDPVAHGCISCGQTSCFRHDAPTTAAQRLGAESDAVGRTAFLVEEFWPEYGAYLAETRKTGDLLALPLDGRRWNLPRYAYDTSEWHRVETATIEALLRAVQVRRNARLSPPQARAAQLEGAERLAERLSRALSSDTTHITVTQSYLPYLWRDGHLGGRTFDVLMTRLPLTELHARLDRAFAHHPERALLGDFRAPVALVTAEAEALNAARRIITPHADIAALFPGRVLLLPWKMPAPPSVMMSRGTAIAFPGPTAARKGAYEVRDAARALNLEVVLTGSELEGADFWQGIRTRRAERGGDWLSGVAAVVQPSLIEDRPRPLLSALAAGVPVITTPGSGLGNREGVTLIPAIDSKALIASLHEIIEPTSQTDAEHLTGIPSAR
jgi:hypothetical protein